MITQSTLNFLAELKTNNNREWFQTHKNEYESAFGDFFDTVVRMVSAISSFDEKVAATRPDPKSCIMRIYRDIRFSKDKTPYKTGFFAYVSAGGRKGDLGGYYLHLEPGESFTGGGLYMPDPRVLEKTRRVIDRDFSEWQAIMSEREMTRWYPQGVQPSGSTKRPPKGYDDSNPAIEYLKYKGYYTQRFLSDAEVKAPEFVDRLAGAWQAVMPMVHFLNQAIEEG